jgi:hypothetical protein
MTIRLRSRQRGLSFIGLLFVAVVLGLAGVLLVEFVPTFIEYKGVQKAADKAQQGTSVVEVRTLFDKSASVDNVTSIKGSDIEVTKEGDRIVVSFAYQREIHLVGPAYLTLKYSGRSK